MNFGLLPTAFHARTGEHNALNAWIARRGFTMPAHYGDPLQEALAARFSAVLIDASADEDLRIQGPGAAALLTAASHVAMHELDAGNSVGVHWCADGGGVRGLGLVSRLGENEFLLRSTDADFGWFAAAAPRFDAAVRETTSERGLMVVAGPFATAILAAAGFEKAGCLEDGEFAHDEWRGFGVTLWRDERLRGYRLCCGNDDAALLFDRVLRAGRPFGLRLAGQNAFDVLQLEAGLLVPELDFTPARENFAREPWPSSLGLEPALLAEDRAARVLGGIALDCGEPCPFMPLLRRNEETGRTLRSLYSPTLRRAIALAQLMPAHASPGTEVIVRTPGAEEIKGRVVTLPFL
jgi:glycine cleavage system aminomethyltransferase T